MLYARDELDRHTVQLLRDLAAAQPHDPLDLTARLHARRVQLRLHIRAADTNRGQ
ncbi:hypothetical protein GCM10027597_64870 [Saccharopolyspora tripterygii]